MPGICKTQERGEEEHAGVVRFPPSGDECLKVIEEEPKLPFIHIICQDGIGVLASADSIDEAIKIHATILAEKQADGTGSAWKRKIPKNRFSGTLARKGLGPLTERI